MTKTQKSVLIIEDETVLSDVYKIVLEAHGYKVYTAGNGLEGIRQLKAIKPAMVLVDLFMPVMDGKEFLRNTNTDDYPATKFVVYTNVSDKKTEAEMRELGAHKFILKAAMAPQDLVKLVAEMTHV